MNTLLLVDSIRRNWIALACTVAGGFMVWAAGPQFSTGAMLAASMGITQFLGPWVLAQMVAPREVLHLPMSQQEIWRTKWAVGTFVCVSAMTIGKMFGLVVPGAADFDTLTLSIALDLLYSAAGTGLLFVLPAGVVPRARLLLAVMVCLIGPILPFAFRHRLPAHWNEVGVLSILLAVLGTALAFLAYKSTPAQVSVQSAAETRAMLRAKRRLAPSIFDGVTGLPRLLLKAWVSIAAMQLGIVIIVPVVMYGFNLFTGEPGSSFGDAAAEFGFLPFGAQAGRPNLVLFWIFGNAGMLSIGEVMRHLRTLPISTRQLLGLLFALSVIAWTNGWLVLAALHFAVTGTTPSDWLIHVLVAFFGIDALLRAFQLRWRNPLWLFFGLMAIGLPILFVLLRLPVQPEVLAGGIGVVGLLASILINKNTLTTRNQIYARLPRRGPFGNEIPGMQ